VQRWLGRTVLSVFSGEFGAADVSYFRSAIERGLIRVNGSTVACDYAVRDGDHFTHATHRHEAPVPADPIGILHLGDGVAHINAAVPTPPSGAVVRIDAAVIGPHVDDLVLVAKPAGIPVHSCGPYHHNSLLSLLVAEAGLATCTPLHRLDRLTSGLILLSGSLPPAPARDFAPSLHLPAPLPRLSAAVHADMVAGRAHKTYMARLAGRFPHQPLTWEGAGAGEGTCRWLTAFAPGVSSDALTAAGDGEEGDGAAGGGGGGAPAPVPAPAASAVHGERGGGGGGEGGGGGRGLQSGLSPCSQRRRERPCRPGWACRVAARRRHGTSDGSACRLGRQLLLRRLMWGRQKGTRGWR
jgi:hypothetical protein